VNRDSHNISQAYLKSRLLKENVEQEMPQSGPFQNYSETMDQNELKDFLTKLMDKNKDMYKIKYSTNKLVVRDSFNDENDPAGEVIMKGTRKDDGKWQIEYNGEYFSQKDWNSSPDEDDEHTQNDNKHNLKYDYEMATAYLPRDIDISTKEGENKLINLAYHELVKAFTGTYKNPKLAARNAMDEDMLMEIISQYKHYQEHGFPGENRKHTEDDEDKDKSSTDREHELAVAQDEADRARRTAKIRKTHGKKFDDWSQFDTQGMDDHGY